MENNLFYILVPVYKTEPYIRECLDSVLHQTYQNFRVIIVDDGTPDRAGEIAEDYAARDDRILVIHQKNMGLIAARDTAVRALKTQKLENAIAMFLDSDDVLRPDAIEVIRQTFVRDNTDMVIFRLQEFSDSAQLCVRKDKTEKECTVSDHGKLYQKVLTNFRYNSLCTKAVCASCLDFDSLRAFYHLSHGEDLLRSLSLYKNCHQVRFLADELYGYRVNPDSITRSVDYSHYSVDTTIRRTVLEFLKSENIWGKQEYAAYFRAMERMLNSDILSILRSDTVAETKKNILDEINADGYYGELMRRAGRVNLLLYMVRERHYIPAQIYAWGYDRLAQAWHWIHRMTKRGKH